MNRTSVLFLSVVSLLVLMLLTALPVTADQNRPCAEDMKKYCTGITPGGSRLLKCYEEQKKNMSPECVAWAELLKKNAAEVKTACSAEIDASCNFSKGDPLQMIDCIQANYTRLSPRCADTLNEFKYYHPVPVQGTGY